MQYALLPIGERIDSTIAQPGESDRYSFTLDAPARLLFDALSNPAGLNWTLTGPDGKLVDARSLGGSDAADFTGNPVLDPSAGTWSLTIDGFGDATGAGSARLSVGKECDRPVRSCRSPHMYTKQ